MRGIAHLPLCLLITIRDGFIDYLVILPKSSRIVRPVIKVIVHLRSQNCNTLVGG